MSERPARSEPGLRIAVVGGGISGLTAAYRLRTLLGDTAELTVFEATDRLGGKLYTADVAGVPFDVGAEAFLARRPEAIALIEELGLAGHLVHPTEVRATVRAGERTVPLPARTLLGVPADADAVAGVLSEKGAAAVAAERELPPLSLAGADMSLGGLLRDRFGDELVDRLVDPLLGGVYAGGADGLGLRAVLPVLADAVEAGAGSLTEAVARLLPASSDAPVFGTLREGMSCLAERLVERSGALIRFGTPVRRLARTSGGWTVDGLDVDAVVLAVPAPAAGKLLHGVVPEASGRFADIQLASMAVVALAYPAGTELPDASGVLIAAGERHPDGTPFAAKAFTFSSRKWAHHAEAGVLVRASVGRFGEQEQLRATDAELTRQVRADLATLTGVRTVPIESVVTRWGGGLPQYGVGHAERVARIEEAVADVPRIAVAGAALHGVGIPACIGTADAAARGLADQLR